MIVDNHVRIVVEDTPVRYYRELQTDVINNSIVDPATPSISVRDFAVEATNANTPLATFVLLAITSNVGSAIVNDIYNVVADPSNKKFIKISIARDNTTGLLEVLAFEKVLGDYDDAPAGKTIEVDQVKEFSVIAAGTTLVEE